MGRVRRLINNYVPYKFVRALRGILRKRVREKMTNFKIVTELVDNYDVRRHRYQLRRSDGGGRQFKMVLHYVLHTCRSLGGKKHYCVRLRVETL